MVQSINVSTVLNMDLELTVENVERVQDSIRDVEQVSFFVVMISVSVFFVCKSGFSLIRVIVSIALLPVIAGISYECDHWAGSSEPNWCDILSKPGLAMQRLTTKEPDDDMIEVGIASVEAVFDWKEYLERIS